MNRRAFPKFQECTVIPKSHIKQILFAVRHLWTLILFWVFFFFVFFFLMGLLFTLTLGGCCLMSFLLLYSNAAEIFISLREPANRDFIYLWFFEQTLLTLVPPASL